MTLAHLRQGSGEPLLLIHGTGSRRQVWDPVLDRLTAERDVVAVDLPGYGESREHPLASEAVLTPEAYAGAVAELIDELGLERPHVAGNSLGGGVALVLGAQGRARSVTAQSPIGFWTPREAEFCRYSIWLTMTLAAAMSPIAPRVYRSPAVRAASFGQVVAHGERMTAEDAVGNTRHLARSRHAVHASLDGYRHWRFVPDGPLPCPVTIAWSERDRLLLPRQAERARRAVPGARHVTLRGCGHVPTWDDPEQVARALLEGSAR